MSKIPRIERVREALSKDCVASCNKAWYVCATEVLRLNSIDIGSYERSLRDSHVDEVQERHIGWSSELRQKIYVETVKMYF